MDENTERPESPEYSVEGTEFDFETEGYWVRIWIDGYYMDCDPDEPEADRLEQIEERFGVDVARNAVHCGRHYEAKDGSGYSVLEAGDYISTEEVAGLRERFEMLRDGRSEGFGVYPEHGLGGKGRPYLQFSASRDGDGLRVHLSTYAWGGPNEFDILLDGEKLNDLCSYFKRINEWFPPVGQGEEQRSRWKRKQTGEAAEDGAGKSHG